jgi:hypothetical protein
MPQILPLPSSIIHRFQVPVITATVAGVPIPAAEVELQRGAPADESDLLEWGRGQSTAPHLRSWPSSLPHHRNGKIPRRALGERFLCEIS